MPDARKRRRWARWLLGACLRSWPPVRRRSHGQALLDTSMELLDDARARGRLAFIRELTGEATALAAEGLAMRARSTLDTAESALSHLLRDLRHGARALLRAPAYTLAVTVTLAVGIGANASVFGLVRGVLMAEPPYEEPGDLVLLWKTLPGSTERIALAGPDAAAVRERARTLAAVAFMSRAVDGAVESSRGDGAEHVRVAEVTPDFFDVLGAEPAIGRTFGVGGPVVEPESPDAVAEAVVAHDAWQRLLGGDTTVVGRTVRLNGVPLLVTGVMGADFRIVLPPEGGVPTDVDVWTPLGVPLESLQRDDRLLDQDSDNSGAAVARLEPGATLEQASREVRAIGARLREEVPRYAASGVGLEARALHADATAHARGILLALLGAAAALLIVACLNVAGLVVARGAARASELAVRTALGADRGTIVRQLLAESALLVGLGLGAALLLGRASSGALARLIPSTLTPPDGPTLDPATLAVALALAGVAVLLAGLLPALRVASLEARGLVGDRLPQRSGARGRTRPTLVVAQVALSVVLLLGAGLLVRTVRALGKVDPGFEPRGALTFDISLRLPERYRSPGDRAALMKEIERRLRGLPGVRAAGYVGVLPLAGDRWTQPYGLPGQPVELWASNRADFRVASSGFFEAVGARLLEGRSFTDREDLEEDERVVVVDGKMARRVAPDGSAVGAEIGVPVDGAPVRARIVGVVEPVRYETLEAEGREAVYVPYRQEASREVSFVVRSSGDPSTLAPAVRRVVREVDPQLPIHGLRPLEAYVSEAVAPRRFALALLALFAGLSLACSALGLYGLVSFHVSRSTRDIGVRMAVGASPGETVRWVLGSGLRLTATGLAAGLLLAALAARSLRAVVFGVGVADPATWVTVVAVVAAVTLLAIFLPARRASRLDPSQALRVD